ncbi:SURF1 family protein [Ruania suaedae]|uniref:SURF1 family protein n=1 Tax=Ruania suaedae TaxID=2897774 RepID=UPI001E5023B0|nr:SURF1 family protein [Ruania suaedae]UFU03842.1 SURF1 family protein [Ruania suaedae]
MSTSGRVGGRTDWVRAATQPRLLGILVILLAGAALCIWLGAWQLDRAQIRGNQEEQVAAAAREEGPAIPLAEVVGPGEGLVQEELGQRVEVQGEWEPDLQVFVEGRGYEGELGYYVLSALRVSGEDALLPVVRGWVPSTDEAALAVPDGPVELAGFLGSPEHAEQGIDPGESTGALVESVSPAQLVNFWDEPTYAVPVRLAEMQPGGPAAATVPIPIGPPEIPDGGLNVRNLAYAAEWWIFGGFALVLWWRMVRDEVRHLRQERVG